MKRFAKSVMGAGAVLALLTACGEREVILSGERLDLRAPLDAPLDGTDTLAEASVNQSRPVALPPAVTNANWTHRNGNPQHRLAHPALGRNLAPLWSAPIGQGNGRKHRITADPVVADGRIFTLDSRAKLTAHSTSGAALWTRDLTPPADRPDDASGGGIAVDGGVVYVTTGFGTLSALNAATGDQIWVQDLDAAATGAPTAEGGVVYVVTRNSVGWAIDARNGRILWQVLGAPSDSGIAGGPAPALSSQLAVFPFASGQMVAAVKGPGTQIWAASVGGKRLGRAFSRISDLTGDPVVAGETIYAGNHSGRAAAFNATTGQLIWSADEGTLGPVWLAGNALFLISDVNRLVRLDAATGETVWAVDLPFFTRNRISRRKATYAHYGPILAGGRLLVASDDGLLRQFDPTVGALIASLPLPGGAASNPVVAGGTLYLVTENGQLHAFR